MIEDNKITAEREVCGSHTKYIYIDSGHCLILFLHKGGDYIE